MEVKCSEDSEGIKVRP